MSEAIYGDAAVHVKIGVSIVIIEIRPFTSNDGEIQPLIEIEDDVFVLFIE
jgi:hypothetical protein